MPLHPLSARVLLASWASALLLWPVAWLVAPVAQGLGTVAAGGSWIGVSAPWGGVPWGLVNEPAIAFAASRAALLGYWLPPLLVPALLGVGLAWLAPTGRGWVGELALFQLVAGLCVAGLGWGALLGLEDGAAAGLRTFWRVPIGVTLGVALASAIGGAVLAVARLGAHLWHAPGGPTRRRRLLLALLHLALPSLAWVLAAAGLGFPLQRAPLLGVLAVVVGGAAGAALLVPHAALHRPSPLSGLTLAALVLGGVLVAAAFSWFGGRSGGAAKAVLWGAERATSNVRPGLARVTLTPPLGPKARRGSSGAGS